MHRQPEFPGKMHIKNRVDEHLQKTASQSLWESSAQYDYMDVSKNRGTPKWMAYNGKPENPIKMDDLGVPLFLETPI